MNRHVGIQSVQRFIGRSVDGRPIDAFVQSAVGVRDRAILVLGGMHGDEPKSVYVALKLLELLQADAKCAAHARWIIVPLVNPDGYARRKRRNARGVDINRNFPTRNWQPGSPRSRMYGGPTPASEPETKAVMRLMKKYEPTRILTIHSIGRGRHCNNYDGPARPLAMAMSRRNGYPAAASIGYPTPGSFGTWAGCERGIPTITLELPSLNSPKQCWTDNREALLGFGLAP